MTVFALGGFWPTYWGPLFSGTLDLHWWLHLHGIVLTTWLAILIAQASLVLRGRTDLHMAMGKSVGVGGATLVVLTAVSAAFGVLSPEVGHEVKSLQSYLQITPAILGDVATFVVLFGAGLVYRARPEVTYGSWCWRRRRFSFRLRISNRSAAVSLLPWSALPPTFHLLAKVQDIQDTPGGAMTV